MSVTPSGIVQRQETRTFLLYGIAVGVLVVVLMALGTSLVSQEVERRRWIEHSYEVISGLNTVLSDVIEAETGQRGLVATSSEDYRHRYNAARAKLATDLTEVSAMVRDNPEQTAKIEELRGFVDLKITDMNQIIALGDRGDWVRLRAFVHPGTGLILMDKIRQTLNRMNSQELLLLRQRTDATLRLNRWVLPIAGAGVVLAGIILLVGISANRRQRAFRAAAEEAFRQSEARFRVLVDRVYDYAIFMLDPNGVVMSWNTGAERMKGYRADEAIGRHFSIFYTEDDIAQAKPEMELRTALELGHCEDEGWRLRKDGSRFWANVSVTAMHDDDGILLGFAKVSRDLTERKLVEDALQEAKELAEASTRAKSTFLATMSHELRTPMTGVLGMIELLQTNPPPAETQLFLATLKSSATSLMTVLGDILDLSKIEADRIVLEVTDFNIVELVSTILTLFMPQASSKGLTLRMTASFPREQAFVRGDPNRLRQVLSNLVNNAIKFTHSGSVDLVVERPRSDDPHFWRFETRDTGIGMTQEECARVFESFRQADPSTARRFGGTGLGLAISKRIVEIMGGEIGAASSVGAGSSFWVRVPFQPGTPKPVSPTEAEEPRDLAPMAIALRILVAEDNPVNQLLCSYMLQQMGHEVTTVGNGRDAVEAVRTNRFDVVLMDMQMPEMDGPDATRLIRQLPGPERGVPIIGLTADVTLDNRERYKASGLDSFITKPIDPRHLRAELEVLTQIETARQ